MRSRSKPNASPECLAKDRDELLAFYDFPAEHWKHLRTTNPIESVFATVRLRHRRTKGSGSRNACLAMVHQLMLSASKRWRLLNGSDLTARRHRRSSIHRRSQIPRSRRLTNQLHPQQLTISLPHNRPEHKADASMSPEWAFDSQGNKMSQACRQYCAR